jgi:hypothetical protein
MSVAADPDPYFAFPKLYGAPAYARPPRGVGEPERPLDPDDLPLAVVQTDDERALASELDALGVYEAGFITSRGPGAAGDAAATSSSDGSSSAGRLSLRSLTGLLGPRGK